MGRQGEARGEAKGPRMAYASCRAWSAVPEGLRRPVSRQAASHIRRVGDAQVEVTCD